MIFVAMREDHAVKLLYIILAQRLLQCAVGALPACVNQVGFILYKEQHTVSLAYIEHGKMRLALGNVRRGGVLRRVCRAAHTGKQAD